MTCARLTPQNLPRLSFHEILMIRFDQVGKRYPGSNEALRDISFEIEQGELVFVTGHSGAGKSTLLKLIAAIERPTSGTVLIGNQNVSKLRPAAVPYLRRKFGMVFQDHKLLYDRNAFDNVALPLYINGISGNEAGKRIRAAMDKVGLLGKEKAMPISLSGGEQQRQALQLVLARMWKARLATLMMCGVMGVTLCLPGILYVIVDNLNRLAGDVQNEPKISLFLKLDTTPETLKELEKRLSAKPAVKSYRFVSKDSAWQELRQNAGLGDVTGGLEQNPLPDAY